MNKLEHCIKRLPEIISQLEGAWEDQNNYALNEDKVENVQDQLEVLFCEITEHIFIYDQCGFWQHQYCAKCNQGKYPELVTKRCGDLPDMTEEQYNV